MKTLILAAALSAAMCDPQPVPPPGPDGSATCEDACSNLRTHGCPAGQPTKAGAPCEEFCENAQQGPAPLNLTCIAKAPSCDVADRCE